MISCETHFQNQLELATKLMIVNQFAQLRLAPELLADNLMLLLALFLVFYSLEPFFEIPSIFILDTQINSFWWFTEIVQTKFYEHK